MDLTRGNIWSGVFQFCLPIFVGQLFQNLYNSVDSIVVGQFVGSNELAAVVACSNISMLITGFFLGLATGASVLFARFFGGRDFHSLKEAIQTTILFTVILGVLITVAGIEFSPQILRLISCPEEVYDGALIYLRIYMAGLLFIALYNVGASILRAIGDSQSPFYYLMISSVTNIVLDLVFVAVIDLGIAGVAIATVIAQGLSMVLCFIKLMRVDETYRLTLKGMHINFEHLRNIIALGVPAGVQTCITSISNIYIQRYINKFGAAAIAGVGSAMRIDQFAGMSTQSLGLGITTFIGQNLGAKKEDRAFKSIRIAIVYALGIIGVTSVPIYIFAPQLMAIFSSDPAVISAGVGMLRTIMPFYEIMGLNGTFSGILRGFGKSTSVMVWGIVGMVAVRQIYLAVMLNISYDIQVIYNGYPLGWICTVAPMVIHYLIIRFRYRKESLNRSTKEV